MAQVGGGKVICPKCGATAQNGPFGQEPNRTAATKRVEKSSAPAITKRRNRARALAHKNRNS